MRITGFIWLQATVDKLETKHHVAGYEVEEVFGNKPQVRLLEVGHVEGENLYSAYGQTDSGRYLTVVFIHKLDHRALIITARDMDRKERKQYGR